MRSTKVWTGSAFVKGSASCKVVEICWTFGKNLITSEVAIDFNVFGSFVLYGILCHLDCRLTVTINGVRLLRLDWKLLEQCRHPLQFLSCICQGSVFSFC
ncbi:unnamed protein product [Linum trigynum]|uniref:Uncharacterized protein n=1 Tax=Linum trigynum TaxID=586398 RepID=A0AAV2FYG3_9ROSI